MKKIFLITTACFTLSACETMNDISWPTMPSLSVFDQSSQTADAETVNLPIPTPDRMTIDTELSEMEKLTGYAPRFDDTPAKIETPSTEIVEDITPAENKVIAPVQKAPITEPIEVAEMVQTVPEVKPTVPTQPEAVEITKAEIPAVTEEAKKEVVETIAPITEVVQAKQEVVAPPAPAIEPIEPVQIAQPTIMAPTETIETPLFTETDLKLSSATGCPQIEIMPSARSMTYFENELSGNLLARAVINEIRGGCEITSNGMELDLDILMNGHITDKGRFEGKRDQEAFMTFPYFVSVLTPQGLPVDKKIMATAMRFRPSVDYLDHAEKITQYIPINDTSNAGNYKIVVGYQLTRKQLEYNRAQTMMRADNNRVAPDLVHRSRKSINPLAE